MIGLDLKNRAMGLKTALLTVELIHERAGMAELF